MSNDPSKKKDRSNLTDDDLFGDIKPIDEFIDAEGIQVKSATKSRKPSDFEISPEDKKVKPGQGRVTSKSSNAQLGDEDLFGDFKPIDEFISSESFEVKDKSNLSKDTKTPENRGASPKVDNDDLFSDFKPLEEFIASDSFEVTLGNTASNTSPDSGSQVPTISQPLSNTLNPPPISTPSPPPFSGPIPPTNSPVAPPTITPAGINSSNSRPVTPPSVTSQSPISPPTITPPVSTPNISNPTAPQLPISPNTGSKVPSPTQNSPDVLASMTPSIPPEEPAKLDPTKAKLAEIAARRKKVKKGTKSDKRSSEDLFDNLEPLEFDIE